MADELYAFSEQNAKRIGASVRAYEGGPGWNRPDKPRPLGERNFSVIPFRNDSAEGETIPAYGVMRVLGSHRDTTDGEDQFFKVAKPNTTFQLLYLVNGDEDVEADSFGWGTWLWHADYVLYDDATGTPALGEMWGPSNDSWKIRKNFHGFDVTGDNVTDTPKRTKALQQKTVIVAGKAHTAIASGGTGTVRVYSGTPGSETDTGMTIASVYNSGANVDDEANVRAAWLHGKPYLLTAPASQPGVLYKLTATKELGGSAAAVLRTFNGTTYVDGAAIVVYDPLNKYAGISGFQGAAIKRDVDSGGTPEYDIIEQEQYARVIGFTLQSPRMELANYDVFVKIDYKIDGIIPPVDGDGDILVHDDQQMFPNALGADYAMEGGAKGWAERNDYLGTAANPYYQVIQCDQRCTLARARLGQTMCGEQHFRVIIEGFEASTKAPFGQVPKPLPTEALNPHKHRGRNDGRWVELKWGKARDPSDGSTVEGWIIHDSLKEKLKVPFQYRARPDNTGLEMRIKEIAIESCEDDQWVPMLGGVPCTP